MKIFSVHFISVCFLLLTVCGCGGSELKPLSQEQGGFEARSGFTVIDSVEQFREAISRSGGKIRVKPGVYKVTDAEADNKTVFLCDGSDNYFDMRGVTIQIDTQVLADLRGKIHSLTVYRMKGDNITFEGAVFEDVGDQPPFRSLQDFTV